VKMCDCLESVHFNPHTRKAHPEHECALHKPRKVETVPSNDFTERYQESAVAMGRFMREAGEHIAANEELDLTPDALIEEIESVQAMLNEAKYYATRMQVYQNLIDAKAGQRRVAKS